MSYMTHSVKNESFGDALNMILFGNPCSQIYTIRIGLVKLLDEISRASLEIYISDAQHYYIFVFVLLPNGFQVRCFEATWLSEGMSHLAEELLFYRISGLAPKQDINYLTAVATPARVEAINAYQVDNLGRVFDYLGATDTNSPYGLNDSLATRGATWNLLRWALDQSPNPASFYLKALVDSDKWGQPNFNQIFAGLGGLVGATRQEVIADFFDNSGVTIAAQYAFPSWNFRDLLPHLSTATPPRYPLVPKILLPGASQTYSLVGGGSGYLRFRVNGGATGGIATSSGGAALPSTVELILIRTQ